MRKAMSTRGWILALATTGAQLIAATASAATAAEGNYPERPVRIVVPFAPGGASDFVGRILQPTMSDLFREQVIIDNRTGAAGNIGVEVAVRATPDGYTMLLGNVGTIAVNPVYYLKFPYHPLKDLIPITQVVDVPGSLVVNPSLPAKSAVELRDYIKANPGKLNFGSAAPSSANNLEMLMWLATFDGKATSVAYKGGAGPAAIGLMSNEVQMMFVTFSSALPYLKQGRMRMLGIVAPERSPAAPEVPTMKEQGYPATVGSWQGLFVPVGTPRNIVNRIFQVAQETVKDPLVVKRLAGGGVVTAVSKSPADFAAFIKTEIDRFGKVIREEKIETQ